MYIYTYTRRYKNITYIYTQSWKENMGFHIENKLIIYTYIDTRRTWPINTYTHLVLLKILGFLLKTSCLHAFRFVVVVILFTSHFSQAQDNKTYHIGAYSGGLHHIFGSKQFKIDRKHKKRTQGTYTAVYLRGVLH